MVEPLREDLGGGDSVRLRELRAFGAMMMNTRGATLTLLFYDSKHCKNQNTTQSGAAQCVQCEACQAEL